jgi:hypothetical protein
MASAIISETIRPAYIWTGEEWIQIGDGGGGGEIFYQSASPLAPAVGTLWVDEDGSVEDDIAGISHNHDLTYATIADLNNIDLTTTIQTASAAAVNFLVDGAPEALNTLNELAAALEDNADILDLYLTQSSASSIYATQAELAAFSSEEFLIKEESYTAESGNVVFVNSASGAYTITLPPTPTLGDKVRIIDLSNNAAINNISVGRNGEKIDGESSNFIIDINNAGVELIYTNNTYGWRTLND